MFQKVMGKLSAAEPPADRLRLTIYMRTRAYETTNFLWRSFARNPCACVELIFPAASDNGPYHDCRSLGQGILRSFVNGYPP